MVKFSLHKAVILLFIVLAGAVFLSCSSSKQKKYFVASYYFPNYHIDKRNEQVHGIGWSEWELVKNAKPRFEGHNQPHIPMWGYTDEANPEDMAQKIDAASGHGIDAFIFDWYYYNDGLFLERGLEEGFMKAPNSSQMKFALMWANHDWIDIHPMSLDEKPELLYPGKLSPEVFDEMTDYVVEKYFSHPSYWKINNRPYFSIYDLQKFLESFGSVEKSREALNHFREKTRQAGFDGLSLNAVIWGNPILPIENEPADMVKLVHDLGFDNATSYVWIHHARLDQFPQTSYNEAKKQYLDFAAKAMTEYSIPYFPNLTMGWDASPRCNQADEFISKGYPFMATLSGNTPEEFRKAAEDIRQLCANRKENERIITVNCWNEWTEGSHLEPDTQNGFKYLEALKEVFKN
ncbi:glycosyltransferase WbsX family protein [Sunxiuqinia sp. A32]|uniref:glycosyltransferase WbsX family protein n=1 Tax=Sunxiuqinia sp. A32 TaxID=3461496 RepID=UPI0040451B62